MKLYVVYINIEPSDYYRDIIRDILPSSSIEKEFYDSCHGIYAFTKSKKDLDSFMCYHDKEIFYVKEKDIDKDEYEVIKHQSSELLINKRKLKFNDVVTENIPLSNHEYNTILWDYSEVMTSMIDDLCYIDYEIFSDEIIKILENIGYVFDWTMIYGSENDIDYMSYNLSYNQDRSAGGLYNNVRYCSELLRYVIIYDKIIDSPTFLKIALRR